MVVQCAVRQPITPARELEIAEPERSRRRGWLPVSLAAGLAAAGVLSALVGGPPGTDSLTSAASAETGRLRGVSNGTAIASSQHVRQPVQEGVQSAVPAAPRVATETRVRGSLLAKSPAAISRTMREPAVAATVLAWDRTSGADSYQVELVRSGTVTYATSAASADIAVPRTWRHDGASYTLQPEDQLFVWPVVDGRRADPVVNGRLAFELTPVARAIESVRREVSRAPH